MAVHYTNTFYWHHWDGVPPALGSESISTFSRAGAAGVGHQHLAQHGEPFTVTLKRYFNSWAIALANRKAVYDLKKLDLIDIWFNGVSMKISAQTQYKCTEVNILSVGRHIFVAGIGYQPGVLVASLTFVPHTKV